MMIDGCYREKVVMKNKSAQKILLRGWWKWHRRK